MPDVPAYRPLVCLLREPATPDPYAHALAAAGFRSRSVPVLRFTFVNQEALAGALRRPADYGGLVFTSPRAVEALAAATSSLTGWVEAWAAKAVFVVGPRTAEAVRALGLHPEGEQAGHAEALAEHIGRRRFDAPLLFLAGNRRRDALPDRLRAAGTPLHELCVYESHPRLDVDLDAPSEVAWLVFFSPTGVEAVRRSGPIDRNMLKIAAIGPTTAAALAAAGWAADAVAATPTPEALVATLLEGTP